MAARLRWSSGDAPGSGFLRRDESMYAVVKIKGQQFRVEPGTKLQVPLLESEVGASVTFDEVLMLTDGEDVKVGQPHVDGASVAAEVLRHGRSRKIVVFKYKRRKNYRRKKGHRQPFTEVSITGING
jgi:large subunit ribosomal protein L21